MVQTPGIDGQGTDLLQEDDFSERALRIGRILERIENLLQGHCILGLFVRRLPYYPISTLPKLLRNLIFSCDMLVDFLRHGAARYGRMHAIGPVRLCVIIEAWTWEF